ncbi:MAG: CoA transferase [Dehalococcoidia bacterium]|nr:CoA transferase [Dehalococcoidia bacterium]
MDALEGLTILDISSHIAGPYTTKLVADLGARVIKVERPGGDPARQLGPWLGDEPGIERSGTYQFLNTNKESVVLDLGTEAGRAVLQDLVPLADLVLVALPPAKAERLGLTYDAIRPVKDVPVVSLTNFGNAGPYRDYALSETVLFAMGGEMWSHGLLDREPLKLGGMAALMQCGAMGAIAALGGAHAYEVHGIGQAIDVPLFEVQINSVDRRSSSILAYRFTGRVNSRPPGPSAGIAGGIYPCADGYVEVTASFGNYWNRFVEMIDDDTFRAPRWLDPMVVLDPTAKEDADAVVYPWMLTRTRREIWEAARNAHAIVAPLFTGKDLYEDPVFRERGLWTEVEHATLGRFPMLGRPYQLDRTPWRIRHAAPMLGEHTRAVLDEAGYDAAKIDSLYAQGVVA